MANKKGMSSTLCTTPLPSANLDLTTTSLPKSSVLHRIHRNKYGAVQFNSTSYGNARFSPIKDQTGDIISTIYCGSTKDCAMMETIFHDVPYSTGFKSYDSTKLKNQLYSQIQLTHSLKLISLENKSLRKMGINRTQLIDTEKDHYPQTRKWAEALHSQCPEAQGLKWVSRQDDSAHAFIFFRDRISEGTLQQKAHSKSLIADAETRNFVADLVEHVGVVLIPE